MRALLIAAAGVLAMSVVNPASAADVAPPRVTKERRIPPPLPAPVFNWTGFYLGGNFGGGWGHSDFTSTFAGTVAGIPLPTTQTTGSGNGSGIVGGGQIGFNYQFLGNWVAGIEADIDAAHIAGSKSACLSTTSGTIFGCGSRDSTIEDFGTVRGRLGYAFNNVLVYGTGGWPMAAAARRKRSAASGPDAPERQSSPNRQPRRAARQQI